MKCHLKRLSALILATALLLTQQVYATGKLTVTSVSGEAGEQVVVEVLLSSDDVCSGNFNVRFSSKTLQLVSAQKGDGNWLGTVNEKEVGLVRVSFAQTEPLTEATLCYLTFKVLSKTPAAGSKVYLEQVRLYNKDSEVVSSELEFGTISRDCVWYSLRDASTVENQDVRAEIDLVGTLQPAGGGFTLYYDEKLLKATGILPLTGLEEAQIDYNLEIPGEVRIAFASDAPLEAGKLCAVVFQTLGNAGDVAYLDLDDVRAYDIHSNPLDASYSYSDIYIVLPTELDPKLWFVGGALSETETATGSVVIQGRGKVCGGQFTLCYDSTISAEVTPAAGVEVQQEHGLIHVSWARETPMLEPETLITISFSQAFESPVTFDSNVRIYDSDSQRISIVDIRPGAITAEEKVHVTVDDVETTSSESGSSVTIAVDLADATFFTEEKLEQVMPMLALYSNGKFLGTAAATDTSFESGVAEISLTLSSAETLTDYGVFILDASVQTPLCKAIESN